MNEDPSPDELLFDVATPLGFTVRVSRAYWDVIVTIQHPVMAGQESLVRETLADPNEIRQSRTDPAVCLFYRVVQDRRLVCAVARRLHGDGFLITTYPTDAIKEGVRIWPK